MRNRTSVLSNMFNLLHKLQINNMCLHIAYVLALYAISGLIPGLISRILSARLKNMIKRREQAFVGMTLK